MLHMEATGYRFLRLAADAPVFNCFRKFRLMLATNFLVGTFLNSSRFSFASNGELL